MEFLFAYRKAVGKDDRRQIELRVEHKKVTLSAQLRNAGVLVKRLDERQKYLLEVLSGLSGDAGEPSSIAHVRDCEPSIHAWLDHILGQGNIEFEERNLSVKVRSWRLCDDK